MSAPEPIHRPTLRALLLLAWPVVLSRAAQAVIGFCDALMTAPLGETALAAVTTGAMNVFALIILPMGIVFIVQSFAAQLGGKGDLPAARRYAYYGLVFAAAVALLGFASIPVIPSAVGLFAFDAAVQADMVDYMGIRIWAAGAIVGVEALGNYYSGLGNTKVHMRASLLMMAVNVVLNWLLIEGHWGAPALGVRGAAIASATASYVGFGAVVAVFLRDRLPRSSGAAVPLQLGELLRMLRFGIPNGLNWFLEFSAFILFLNVVVAGLGTVPLAAMMVVLNINSVSFMPAFGIASAGAILAGQAIGAGRHDDVPTIVWLTVRVTATWQGAVGLVYLTVPKAVLALFESPTAAATELRDLGAMMLMISVAWQLFDALAMTLSEALRSAGDTAWAMWARVVIAWVLFMPGSYVAVLVLGGGPSVAIWSIVAYLAVLAIVLSYRFLGGAWREIDLVGSSESPA